MKKNWKNPEIEELNIIETADGSLPQDPPDGEYFDTIINGVHKNVQLGDSLGLSQSK